jgi:hypothetical protein
MVAERALAVVQRVSADWPALVLAVYRHSETAQDINVAVYGFGVHFHFGAGRKLAGGYSVRSASHFHANHLQALERVAGCSFSAFDSSLVRRAPNQSLIRDAGNALQFGCRLPHIMISVHR